MPADARPNWEWNTCHTYHYVNLGQGNVSSTVWDGDKPQGPAPMAGPQHLLGSVHPAALLTFS